MKKIMPNIAGVFFAMFSLGIVALLMSYTWQALARIFPDNLIAQAMGMILFDVGALAWLGAFIYLSKSAMQYAFSFIGFVFGVLGTLGMVAVEVMLGGQELMTPPEWINSALVYGFVVAAAAHVILFYAYKIAAPEVNAEISLGIETANITEEAMKQAEEALLAQRGALGSAIAPRLINNVRRNLGLPIGGEVIDLPAQDVNDLTQATPVYIPPRKMSFTERLKAAARVLTNPQPAAPRVYAAQVDKPAAPAPAPQPEESEEAAAQPDPLP